jgi:hypothetical protein
MSEADEDQCSSVAPPRQPSNLAQFCHDKSTQAESERDTIGLVYEKFETVLGRNQHEEGCNAEQPYNWPHRMGKDITDHKAHRSQATEYHQAILNKEIDKRILKGKREERHKHTHAVLLPVKKRPPVETHQHGE